MNERAERREVIEFRLRGGVASAFCLILMKASSPARMVLFKKS